MVVLEDTKNLNVLGLVLLLIYSSTC